MPKLDKNDKILTPLDVIPHHLAASSNLGPSLDAITGGVYSPPPSLYISPKLWRIFPPASSLGSVLSGCHILHRAPRNLRARYNAHMSALWPQWSAPWVWVDIGPGLGCGPGSAWRPLCQCQCHVSVGVVSSAHRDKTTPEPGLL